jgi:hypothetical protein
MSGLPSQVRNSSHTQFRVLAALTPESCSASRPRKRQRAQGMPGAGCTRGLVCPLRLERTHTSIQVQPEHPGIPCAMVLRLISCSPRGPGFLAPVIGVDCEASRRLGASVGAPGPHDFAVRAPRSFVLRSENASTATPPASVTIGRNAPLPGTGWPGDGIDFGKMETKYFLRKDWTTQISLNRLGKFDLARRQCRLLFRPRAWRGVRENVSDLPVGQRRGCRRASRRCLANGSSRTGLHAFFVQVEPLDHRIVPVPSSVPV